MLMTQNSICTLAWGSANVRGEFSAPTLLTTKMVLRYGAGRHECGFEDLCVGVSPVLLAWSCPTYWYHLWAGTGCSVDDLGDKMPMSDVKRS